MSGFFNEKASMFVQHSVSIFELDFKFSRLNIVFLIQFTLPMKNFFFATSLKKRVFLSNCSAHQIIFFKRATLEQKSEGNRTTRWRAFSIIQVSLSCRHFKQCVSNEWQNDRFNDARNSREVKKIKFRGWFFSVG